MSLEETGDVTAGSTAEGAASLRAIGAAEPDPAVRNPDHLAAKFISPGLKLTYMSKVPGVRRLVPHVVERILPGAYPFETARTIYMDEVLLDEVAAGAKQVVFLGAGFDTRSYRLEDELAAVELFEVDHPATGRVKRERLVDLFGSVPRHVQYVWVDFAKEDLGERLIQDGYDHSAPTFFIWSGVAPYLDEEAVESVIAFVASNGSPRSSIIFDYLYREVLEGDRSYYGATELMERISKIGEPFRSGIPRGTVESWLAERGLTLEREVGPDDAEAYLKRSDGTMLGKPYGFGGIVHARVTSGADAAGDAGAETGATGAGPA